MRKDAALSLSKGWEIKKLGEIAKINYGYTEKASYTEVGPRFLRITDIKNDGVKWSSVPYCECSDSDLLKFQLEEDDIVFARTGATTGKSFLVKNPPIAVFASYLIRLKLISKQDFSSDFVSYYFQTKFYWDKINEGISGSAQGGFNASKLGQLIFPIPPLPEQKRIVAILDQSFTAIAKAKTNAEQNLKNAKELFESYLQGVFENKGEGWNEKRFDEVCVLQRGFDLPKRLRNSGSFPLVSSNGITDKIDLCKVNAPGVVTGRSGTIGNVHFIEEDFWPLNTALYIKEFHGNYERCIYYFLKQFDLGKYSSGAGVPTLNRNNVHCEMVWFPSSYKEQQAIVQKLDALSLETKRLEAIYQKKIVDLEDLKKSILQKAFSGKLSELG